MDAANNKETSLQEKDSGNSPATITSIGGFGGNRAFDVRAAMRDYYQQALEAMGGDQESKAIIAEHSPQTEQAIKDLQALFESSSPVIMPRHFAALETALLSHEQAIAIDEQEYKRLPMPDILVEAKQDSLKAREVSTDSLSALDGQTKNYDVTAVKEYFNASVRKLKEYMWANSSNVEMDLLIGRVALDNQMHEKAQNVAQICSDNAINELPLGQAKKLAMDVSEVVEYMEAAAIDKLPPKEDRPIISFNIPESMKLLLDNERSVEGGLSVVGRK